METREINSEDYCGWGAGSEKKYLAPSQCLLEGFITLTTNASGLDLQRLAVNDSIHLRTHNSEYRIVILDPASYRVMAQGGSFFAEPTEAIIRGASCGGAMLKIGWIMIDLQLELVYYPSRQQPQSVITSPVEALYLRRAGVQC
ncbi:MAG: hypothetical protein L0Y75_10895 [Acidobacteria bacterium]|nr:hypothetical protein [Acidobacteriota bacterium]